MVNFLGLHISRTSNAATIQQPDFNANTMQPVNSRMRAIRSDYANNFAQVNALVQEAVNRSIYPLDQYRQRITYDYPKVWQVLQAPNENYSFKSFLNDAMVGFLSNTEVDILLWHDNGNGAQPGYTSLDTFCGMTFLPRSSRFTNYNRIMYRVRDQQGGSSVVGSESVLALRYSVDPDTLVSVSPGSASHEVTKILDSMNMQLNAYFNNNATPQLQVVIHAKTTAEFNSIKRNFENANRGPARAYGTVYSHVIDNGVMGDGTPRIEMQVVGANGDNLAVKDITDYAQGQINANLGVSPLIYGDTDSTSYQNQEVVNDKFNRRVVNTLNHFLETLSFELNRVTGGIGFTFGYDYEETEFAEKNLTQAQTVVAQAQAFQTLVNLKVASDVAARAVGRDDWCGLDAAPAAVAQPAQPAMPQVNMPVKVVMPETPPPNVTVNTATGATTRVIDRQTDEHDKIKQILLDMAQAHIQRWKTGRKSNALPDQDSKYVNQLLAELQQIADNGGVTVARQLAQQIHTQTISTGYEMQGTALQKLTDRATKVIRNYSGFLDDQIADATASSTDMTTGETIQPSDADAASTLADSLAAGAIASYAQSVMVNEGKYAFQSGQQDNAEQIQQDMQSKGIVITKTWRTTSGHPCEFCASMDGTEAGAADAFVTDGMITTPDGDTMALDGEYTDGELPDGHVNCQCVFVWTADESGVPDGE